MRHRNITVKLGRTSAHRDALFSGLVCNLIERGRIRTTLPKARALRSLADRMVTLAKRGTLAARRNALQRLHRPERVARLFGEIGPAFADRKGGYTRVIKLGRRLGDGAEMVLVEWTNYTPPAPKKRAPKKGEDKKPAV
jgi:large subunit ribosomal protein L17